MWEVVLAAGIPSIVLSGIFGAFIHRIERRDDEKREQERKREEARKKLELLQIRGTLASMALGEATAKALKNGHCNGETESALEYDVEVKREINDFLSKQGIENVSR